VYPNIFSPIHIIFFELIMAPTCSIIYENEPMEKNTMTQPPRPFTTTFFNAKELAGSMLQGLVIAIGVLTTYQVAVQHGCNEAATKTMVFIALITANIFLTLVNRSFYYSMFTTTRYKNYLVPAIIGTTILISALILFIDPLTSFFEFQRLAGWQFAVSCLLGFSAATWYELVKWYTRSKNSAI
jgi:P-type Ca2+ transporter type 2C